MKDPSLFRLVFTRKLILTFLLLACSGLLLDAQPSFAAVVTRGPYLQIGTPDSVTIRWRTDVPTDSRVLYGTDLAALTSFLDDGVAVSDHVVKLTNLLPGTKYYYSIGSTAEVLRGGDTQHFFITSPLVGTPQSTRVWVLGDSGTANSNARAVRDAYLNFNGSQYTNLWLMLGDNAYSTGTDTEYQAAVFDMYPSLLKQSPLWATLGNHDGQTADSASQSGPYYDIFTLPTMGEAGGLPSGTEAYYSFDYANIHFICLDSYETSRSTTGAMLTWLRNDVVSTTQPWIIAFWHHPPYSKGSHNSDTETPLIEMRRNVLPILEQAGVDLVLTGHSHSYERSYLLDGHYDVSSTFTSAMKKDGGSGREDGTGAYRKTATVRAPREGAVYAVAGSSGQISGGQLNHPAMFLSLNVLGSIILDVNGNRLDAKFIDNLGTIRDYFTITKEANTLVPQAPSQLTASAISSTQIDLAWQDNSGDEQGFKIEHSTDGTTYQDLDTTAANATTYSAIGLSPSTRYYYRIRAYNGNGNSEYSNVADTTTLNGAGGLNAPSSLAATPVSTTAIELAWADNSDEEQGFKIEQSTDGITFQELDTAAANATSYSAIGLSPSTRYYYRILAYNDNGTSPYSNIADTTTQAVSGGLTAPSSLAATPISSTRIDLAWADNSDNEEGFQVERSPDGVNFTQIALVGPNVSNYSNTGLTAKTLYHYRVQAYNGTDMSGFSNVASATTLMNKPSSPSALIATAISPTQINLSWTDNSGNEAGYSIERSLDNVTFTEIATVGANIKAFSDSGLLAAKTYYYRIRAFNNGGYSGYSNTANATTLGSSLPAPSGLSATTVSRSSIDLRWTDNSITEQGFKIERSTNGTSFSQIATVGANVVTYRSSGLSRNRKYYYRVRAYNSGGNSAYSNTASATTLR